MEERILQIMREVLDDNSIDTSSNQQNCENWDSLHQLSLISKLEDEFDVDIEPEEIAEMTSFEKVKDILSTKL